MFQSMNKRFFFHSFRTLMGMVVFFLIPPPTILKKNLQKVLSSSFSSKCRLKLQPVEIIDKKAKIHKVLSKLKHATCKIKIEIQQTYAKSHLTLPMHETFEQ